MFERDKLKESVFLEIAYELSSLGTCSRSRVGAVITYDGRCISWGYNGAPPGMPHCDEVNHGFGDPDDPLVRVQMREHGCRNATHAESNAVAFAARQGIPTDDGTLYVTISPCRACAQILVASGIRRVVYSEPYRDPAGLELLRNAGVEVLLHGEEG